MAVTPGKVAMTADLHGSGRRQGGDDRRPAWQWLTLPLYLFPQPPEPLQPRLELGLEPLPLGLVEPRPGEGVGQAVEAGRALFGVGGVDVAGAVAQALHQFRGGVADDLRHRIGRAL